MQQSKPERPRVVAPPLPTGEEPMPNFLRDARARANQSRVEVNVEPGAGEYEDKFRYYWLATAWVYLGYIALTMVLVIFHMATTSTVNGVTTSVIGYNFMVHMMCTAITVCSVGCLALVYRLVLFPPPGQYTRSYYDHLPDGVVQQQSQEVTSGGI